VGRHLVAGQYSRYHDGDFVFGGRGVFRVFEGIFLRLRAAEMAVEQVGRFVSAAFALLPDCFLHSAASFGRACRSGAFSQCEKRFGERLAATQTGLVAAASFRI